MTIEEILDFMTEFANSSIPFRLCDETTNYLSDGGINFMRIMLSAEFDRIQNDNTVNIENEKKNDGIINQLKRDTINNARAELCKLDNHYSLTVKLGTLTLIHGISLDKLELNKLTDYLIADITSKIESYNSTKNATPEQIEDIEKLNDFLQKLLAHTKKM